jgi:hypothetical protein
MLVAWRARHNKVWAYQREKIVRRNFSGGPRHLLGGHMSPQQQAEMLQPEETEPAEPDWKRRAREQAEKLEREWEQEAMAEAPSKVETVATESLIKSQKKKRKENSWRSVTTTTSTTTTTRTKTRLVHPSSVVRYCRLRLNRYASSRLSKYYIDFSDAILSKTINQYIEVSAMRTFGYSTNSAND